MVAIVCWLSLTPHPPEPPDILGWDKSQHFVAYAALMAWFRQSFFRHWRWPAFLLGLGLTLEYLQSLTGYRTADVFDMLANGIGVLIGWGLAGWLPRMEWLDGMVWRKSQG